MKKQFSVLAVFALLFALAVNVSSCEKDEGKKPNIAFKVASGYTSADASVTAGDSVLIGIVASKSEGEDVLKTLNISASVDGATAVTVTNGQITIPSAQEDNYNAEWKFPSASVATHNIKYTFTVTNRDGITNAVSLTVTSN